MFRKRIKKEFPPGTFIPMPARICAIAHLCLAFVIILWNISQPFMGELFTYKSHMLLYQDIMGISKSTDSIERLARLERNKQRFEAFSAVKKAQLIRHYQALQQLSQRTFFEKLHRTIHILIFESPFYEKLWLILSLVLPILLLKQVEGASQAIWLLPLLTSIYAFDNYIYGQEAILSTEARLFPSEHILVNDYLQNPLSSNLLEQKEQLLSAWKLYLIHKWSPQVSFENHADLDRLAEEGEFAFNVARVQSQKLPNDGVARKTHDNKESIFVLAIYLFWNFFFAATVFRLKYLYSHP